MALSRFIEPAYYYHRILPSGRLPSRLPSVPLISEGVAWWSTGAVYIASAVLLLMVWRQRLAFRPVRLPSSALLLLL